MNRQNEFEALFEQAVEHHRQGRLAEALALYEAAIGLNLDAPVAAPPAPAQPAPGKARDAPLQPGCADAHFNKAIALKQLTRLEEAVESYDRAIAIDPELVEAWCNRGNTLRELGRAVEALASFDAAIRLRPDFALAHHNKASALHDLRRWDEAFESYERAIALEPDFVEARENLALAHNNKGSALRDQGRWNEALECYERAIALKPGFAQAHLNRANTLRLLGRPDEALPSCDRAIAFGPDLADSYVARGNALKDLMRLPEALESYDRAIALNPDCADAYWNKSYCALLVGDFGMGWPLHEWRRKKTGAPRYPVHPQPEWTGAENLAGKTLLIYAEQGLGDTIQFCRYALLAQAKGARVIFVVQPALVRLMKSLGRGIEIISPQTDVGDFDYYIPLLSMPGAFRTSLSNCPSATPYLAAEPEQIMVWRNRLGMDGFRIGICWHGNRKTDIDMGRSIPPDHFARLGRIPATRLIGLQKDDGAGQSRDVPPGLKIESLGHDFDAGRDAFIDTAAVMENLDLIVTSDTAVAHLAGALDRPVWTLLPFSPDWRWLLERSDTPWYPSMRLFRQTRRNDWSDVFTAIDARLEERMADSGTGL
jgi:tetratricopeptide (TPR) repeat protein